MKSLSIRDLAILHAQTSSISVVVVTAASEGSFSRLPAALPLLDEAAINTLCDDGAVALSFDTETGARSTYGVLCENVTDENTLVTGDITIVHPNGDVVTFEIDPR